jgi:hypothetical protein
MSKAKETMLVRINEGGLPLLNELILENSGAGLARYVQYMYTTICVASVVRISNASAVSVMALCLQLYTMTCISVVYTSTA